MATKMAYKFDTGIELTTSLNYDLCGGKNHTAYKTCWL